MACAIYKAQVDIWILYVHRKVHTAGAARRNSCESFFDLSFFLNFDCPQGGGIHIPHDWDWCKHVSVSRWESWQEVGDVILISDWPWILFCDFTIASWKLNRSRKRKLVVLCQPCIDCVLRALNYFKPLQDVQDVALSPI